MKSTAPVAAFAFANLDDEGLCHISFSLGQHEAVNVRIPGNQVQRIADNLQRVLEAQRGVLFHNTIKLQDRICELELQLAESKVSPAS